MDSRVSTAPGPKAKRWSKNPGSSHLLRNVKSVSADSFAVEVAEEESRPQTCPAPTLTPHLHWNLNDSALTTLPKSQVDELYGLFQFYDSSAIGDALPSINCTRFVEILRDAQLLSDRRGSNDGNTGITEPLVVGLEVESVERIFAQAVMGKMRVYLDADDQPALTFSLFCGAIMNCAMLLLPSEHPAAALRQILPTLLECSIGNENHPSAAMGLLGHLPADGALSCWVPEEAHAPIPQPEDADQDFRDLPSFQQVIADCESDKVVEELRQETVARLYEIPDRLRASFEHDTIELISNKFRVFDVAERGVLPRHEIFALLSGLGKRADLPDPYSVLPRLFASMSAEHIHNGGISSGSEMTLAELLLAIEITREAKRHSSAARLASMKIRLNRAATTARHSLSSAGNADGNNQSLLDLYDAPVQNKAASTESSKDGKTRGRRRGALKPRKSTLSQASDCSGADGPIRVSLAKNPRGSKAQLTHHPSTSSRKKTTLPRRSSSINSKKAETMTSVAADLLSQEVSTSRKQTVPEKDPAAVETDYLSLDTDEANSDDVSALQQAPNADNEAPSNIITVEVYEPPSANNRKTLRIFLLLGGDHDGAICCTISLVLATKDITESEGIYYATAPNETTRTVPVLPIQKTLMTALRMLKKRVLIRMERGFEQRPTGQLGVVDEMLRDLNKHQPHYSTPIIKTWREAPVVPMKQHVGVTSASSSARRSEIARHVSSAPSDHARMLPLKLPPHSKTVHLTSKLPDNYRDLLATWQASRDKYKWIYDVNAASPLKPALYSHNQAMPCRSGHLSPLRFLSRQLNQFKNTGEP